MPHVDAFSWNLILATAGVAITHTLFGPDHYLPFIMLARARHWSRPRTVLVTTLCGLGHILSSLLLGAIGLAAGSALAHIKRLEGMRGDWAAWALFGFGIAYLVWGVRKAIRTHSGIAAHAHGIGVHIHTHGDHVHAHPASSPAGSSAASKPFRSYFLESFHCLCARPLRTAHPAFRPARQPRPLGPRAIGRASFSASSPSPSWWR